MSLLLQLHNVIKFYKNQQRRFKSVFKKWIVVSMNSKLNAVERIWVEKKIAIEFGCGWTKNNP